MNYPEGIEDPFGHGHPADDLFLVALFDGEIDAAASSGRMDMVL